MQLSDKYRIDFDENNVMLRFFETREKTKKDGAKEPYEYVETTFHGTVKNALNAFLQKSIRGSESVVEVLKRIEEVEEKIDLLIENSVTNKK